jgi:hydroxymethylbilane synthase
VLSLPLRIGTRGSPMALSQTGLVRGRLMALHPDLAAAGAIEMVTIRTTGDRVQDRRLAEIGGKGLFTKEIEEALLAGHIDLAVHSLKDMETWLPAGLEIACMLPRDDPRDALVSKSATGLATLPKGARIGTASLRRQAQLLLRRPDLSVAPLRGNVNTRLRKLQEGEFDAVVLAVCGLERLGKADLATEILSPEIMLPAVGQGVLAIECRAGDDAVRALLGPAHDPSTAACAGAERAMLAALDGSCRTPIAGFAELDGHRLTIEGLVLKPDGSNEVRGWREGNIDEAEALGAALGDELRRRAGPDLGLGDPANPAE